MRSRQPETTYTVAAPIRLYVQTFGCQMNDYDSLRMRRTLAQHGYVSTERMEDADVIVLNTCSVRDKAEQKVHSMLGRLKRLKVRRPGLKIVVAGCVAQQLGGKLLKRFDQVDLVLGTRGVDTVPELLERLRQTGERLVHLPETGGMGGCAHPGGGGAAIAEPVTIMQGCDNFCTYCIVPYVRGRERSRPADEILDEIRMLEAAGTREVMLLGQNVNSYGRGLETPTSFPELLRRVHEETGLERIRFTTSHPKDLTQELIDCFRDLPRLCKFLHLPFQAGSDRVLKRMHRRYTAADYLDKIDRVRDACPGVALSSDVMVGFPGETDEDFRQTLALLRRVRFDNLFSFAYSDRPFAKASEYPEKVDDAVKSARLLELQALQAEIAMERNRAEEGRTRRVLVEGPSKAGNGEVSGRTEHNRVVNFPGDEKLIGQEIRVRIVAAFAHSLKGERDGDPED